jgi:hypothetical protein
MYRPVILLLLAASANAFSLAPTAAPTSTFAAKAGLRPSYATKNVVAAKTSRAARSMQVMFTNDSRAVSGEHARWGRPTL